MRKGKVLGLAVSHNGAALPAVKNLNRRRQPFAVDNKGQVVSVCKRIL